MRTILLLAAFCLSLLCADTSRALPDAEQKSHTNSIGMEFVLIPAGSFNCLPYYSHDEEQVEVRTFIVSKAFYLGKYPVTQEQWKAVMGNNPSRFKGRTNPVENVSWEDAQQFLKRLNAREKHTRYRLPTATEWKLAARGGTRDIHFFFIPDMEFWSLWGADRDGEGSEAQWGTSPRRLAAYAWFNRNSKGSTHPVGLKKPNQYGLHDIYGNVWEWVQDWWGSVSGKNDREITDYRGPASGGKRVVCGCDWYSRAHECGSDATVVQPPSTRNDGIGFRLALSLE
jgi:formylglycine-generating enzyme required for sulfatase activity